ncbi:uncharacterized protein LOC133793437 isoform X2 [Humulus lupulus]|uniref:uncharacterized protein LOC133793437 isoform X2 n=1 Tax=Humulus lupulus TaxID=3486 RepID=UPI002B4164FC|nr:uncharacterized protein LOC133793437 isoform X2 [Humulus lupulus]
MELQVFESIDIDPIASREASEYGGNNEGRMGFGAAGTSQDHHDDGGGQSRRVDCENGLILGAERNDSSSVVGFNLIPPSANRVNIGERESDLAYMHDQVNIDHIHQDKNLHMERGLHLETEDEVPHYWIMRNRKTDEFIIDVVAVFIWLKIKLLGRNFFVDLRELVENL